MLVLSMFPLASAFTEGQTFTQTQIDNFDITTLNKNDIDLQLTGYSIRNRYSAILYYDYLEIFPDGQGVYVANYTSNGFIINAVEFGQECYTAGISKADYITCIQDVYIEGKTDKFLDYVRYDIFYYKTGVKSALLAWLDTLIE